MFAVTECWAAFDLRADGPPGAIGHRCLKRLCDGGFLIKWTGDTAIGTSPLIAKRAHIHITVGILRDALHNL